jgi:hypothetical protein
LYSFVEGLCNFLHGSTLKSVCRFVEALVVASAARTWLVAGVLAERERVQFKSALQAVSRVLGNARVDMWLVGARLLERVTREGDRAILALDWTEWVSEKRALVAAAVIGRRATPIAAEGFDRANIARSQNAWEDTFLRMLKELLRVARRAAVVVADRGFRRASFMKQLQRLEMDFVVRLMVKAMVHSPGKAKGYLLSRLQLRPGQMRDLGVVELKADRSVRVRIVGLWARGQKEPWWLATSLDSDLAEVASIYDRRMAVEQQFRDTKGCRYGVEVIWNQFEQPERIGRLFVYVGIALAVWTAMGHEIAEHDPTALLPHRTKGPRRSFATIGRQAMRAAARSLDVTSRWLRKHIPRPELRPMALGLRLVRTRLAIAQTGAS